MGGNRSLRTERLHSGCHPSLTERTLTQARIRRGRPSVEITLTSTATPWLQIWALQHRDTGNAMQERRAMRGPGAEVGRNLTMVTTRTNPRGMVI